METLDEEDRSFDVVSNYMNDLKRQNESNKDGLLELEKNEFNAISKKLSIIEAKNQHQSNTNLNIPNQSNQVNQDDDQEELINLYKILNSAPKSKMDEVSPIYRGFSTAPQASGSN